MIGFLIRNNDTLAFRDNRTEDEKLQNRKAMTLLTSLIADVDVITDWIYYTETVQGVNDDGPTNFVPPWILLLQLVSCICGSVSWCFIASDGRVLDWLRMMLKWILVGPLWLVHFVVFKIPRMILPNHCFAPKRIQPSYGYLFLADKLNILIKTMDDYFNHGFHISSGALVFLGILSEDIPQIIVTFLIEEAIRFDDGRIRNSASLNVVLAVIDIFHKLANAWDHWHVVIKASSDDAIQTFRGHGDIVTSLTTMERNQLLSVSWDKTAKVWDLTKGICVKTLHTSDWLYGVANMKDRQITAGNEGISIFDIDSDKLLKKRDIYNGLKCVAVSLDGSWFITGGHNIIRWDATNYELLETYEKGAFSLTVLDDNRFVSGGHCCVWEVGKQEPLREFALAGSCESICRVSSNSFLTGSTSGIELWNADTGECIRKYGNDKTICLTLVNDALFASGGEDGDGTNVAKLWSFDEPDAPLATFKGHTNIINDVVYLPERNEIATASNDHSIKLWSITEYITDNDEDHIVHTDYDEHDEEYGPQ
mmetsp:Transcript_6075/g.9323  ORF Transcript_6075/g.9323 Transcript_6075/m.9323 type:complete len:537 (+) Transcript_6075:71-1681(+)